MKYIVTTNGWMGTKKQDVIVSINDIIKTTFHPFSNNTTDVVGRINAINEHMIVLDTSKEYKSDSIVINIAEILKLEVIGQ